MKLAAAKNPRLQKINQPWYYYRVIYMIRQVSIEGVMLCADCINTLFINFDINILTDFLRKYSL